MELLPHKFLLTKAKLQKISLRSSLFAFCAKINFDGNTRFRLKPVCESCGVLKIASRSSVTASFVVITKARGSPMSHLSADKSGSELFESRSQSFVFNLHTRSSRDDCACSANGISGSQKAAALSSLTADDDREDDSHPLVFLSAGLKPSERHSTTKQHRADLNFQFFTNLYVADFREKCASESSSAESLGKSRSSRALIYFMKFSLCCSDRAPNVFAISPRFFGCAESEERKENFPHFLLQHSDFSMFFIFFHVEAALGCMGGRIFCAIHGFLCTIAYSIH